jgi:hypothetical protein
LQADLLLSKLEMENGFASNADKLAKQMLRGGPLWPPASGQSRHSRKVALQHFAILRTI